MSKQLRGVSIDNTNGKPYQAIPNKTPKNVEKKLPDIPEEKESTCDTVKKTYYEVRNNYPVVYYSISGIIGLILGVVVYLLILAGSSRT